MTERKPPEISFASWVDQQINEAAERGAFDDLPGAGKPLPKWGEAGDGQTWLRDYLRREGVSAEELLPLPLRLRKEIERMKATVHELGSEQEVREVVAALNQRIHQWRRIPVGPPVFLRLVDEEEMLARWREARPALSSPAHADPEPPSPRPRWWHRFARRGRSSPGSCGLRRGAARSALAAVTAVGSRLMWRWLRC
jgi:DnaJ homologue, subfamily C, member 28, conserved domain